MNTEHTNQSRTQFEAWASEHCCSAGGISFKRFSDDGADSVYNDPSVETAWQAWQAASQQQGEPAEHGLYVILYRDNWDGGGATSYLLARLDPNGEWYAEESGAQLMTYEGDAILRAWPITEDTAMQPDPRPVLNCWCCSTLVTFKQRANADGNCPHCGAELDVDKDLAAAPKAAAPCASQTADSEPQTGLCRNDETHDEPGPVIRQFGYQPLFNAISSATKWRDGRTIEISVLDFQEALLATAPQAAVATQLPQYDAFSNDDGDSWQYCPDDAKFVDGRQLGEEFELLAGWQAERVTFRVTKVPDDESDDYEVEEVTEPAAAQKGGAA